MGSINQLITGGANLAWGIRTTTVRYMTLLPRGNFQWKACNVDYYPVVIGYFWWFNLQVCRSRVP